MRSPKKRSLLSVNEHFEGKRNDKIHFLFTLILLIHIVVLRIALIVLQVGE